MFAFYINFKANISECMLVSDLLLEKDLVGIILEFIKMYEPLHLWACSSDLSTECQY